MQIESLNLTNFRNYEQETIEFCEGINILVGTNGQGKTNIAEAIYYLCTGYSLRARQDKQLINYDCEKGKILGIAKSLYGKTKVEIDFYKNDKKTVKINDIGILNIGELMENMRAVYFSPGELKLVQEAPEDRRRFLNISLSQMYKKYFYALKRYNKIIEQRNALLKEFDKDMVRETLGIWDIQLSKEAAKIIVARNNYIAKLSPYVSQIHKDLSLGKEEVIITFEQGFYGEEQEVQQKVYTALKESREKDIRLGYTTVGPHRDDLKITLNGKDVRIYCSQGQQRTTALSIKLAETKIFKEMFKEYPILILDDVFSELDKKRHAELIKKIAEMQTIITATQVESALFKKVKYKKINIVNGKVKSTKVVNDETN